jgi:hypothetical protein
VSEGDEVLVASFTPGSGNQGGGFPTDGQFPDGFPEGGTLPNGGTFPGGGVVPGGTGQGN